MDWRSFFIMFAKAALRVLAEELEHRDRKRRRKKEAPQAPRGSKSSPPSQPPRASKAPQPPGAAKAPQPQYAPQSAESAGWGASAGPQPVPVIRIETDDGSVVSPLSVLGERAYVEPRPQRERKPGESRRVRRGARAEEMIPAPAPRTPEMEACVQRMRARAKAAATRQGDEEAQRVTAAAKAAQERPVSPPRRVRAGEPMTATQLTPATLLLLAQGEPLTDAWEVA